jgi:hypothetical protein
MKRKSLRFVALGAVLSAQLSSIAGTVTWLGGSGDWGAATNWSTGTLPGANDDVVVGSGASITVTHSSGTDTVKSLTSQQAFQLSGGTLTVSGTVQVNNTFTLAGGTLARATVLQGTGGSSVVVNYYGVFDGVTMNEALDVGGGVSGAILTVTNGLVLNATALVGGTNGSTYGAISFAGNQALGGSGAVVFGTYNGWGSGSANALFLAYGGTSLVIGSGITIRGQTGSVGAAATPWNSPANVSVVNTGSISADAGTGTITINAQPFNNQGLAQSVNGGTLVLSGAWNNNGTLAESYGTVYLAGSFSLASIGTLNRTNGTIYVGGILTNTGTLTLSAASGSWVLQGGSILGGTVTTANGVSLVVQGSGTLNGVTLNGVVDVGNSVNFANLIVTNGLVLNGTALVGNPTNSSYGAISFVGNQVLGGSGTVAFGNSGCNALNLANEGTTLVVGFGLTVHGQSGQIGYAPSCWGGSQNASVINQGTISADVMGGTIMVNSRPFSNQGLAQALNGGTLQLVGNWSNGGQLGANGGTLNLGGGFSEAALGVIHGTGGGTVALTGTLTNGGGILTIDGSTGSWALNGGAIQGGTVLTKSGTSLVVSSGTLDGVTVNGVLDIGNSVNGGSLMITNGLVLNGTAQVGNPTNGSYGAISFVGNQVLGGSGTVAFGNSGCNAVRVSNDGTTLVVGLGITVHGQSGQIGYAPSCWGGSQNVGVINQGTISADVAGGTITVNAQPLNSQGLAQATNGGTLQLLGNWSNPGELAATGGTLNLGGTFSQATLGTIHGSGGAIAISGLLTNVGGILGLDGAVASWTLAGGTIEGGSVLATNGASLVVSSGTLDGVTVNGVLDVGNSVNGGNLTITNGLVLNGTALVGNPTNGSYGAISFAGNQVLGGSGMVAFGNSSCNALRLANDGTTLVIGPGISVRGQNGQIGYSPCWGGSQKVGVSNQGTIAADVVGGIIYIAGQSSFQNNGFMRCTAGNIALQAPISAGGLGAFEDTGGFLVLATTLDNRGSTLLLNGTSNVVVLTGVIRGGTVAMTNGALLIAYGTSATLDGVTLNGDLDIGDAFNAASLVVTNGLTLNGTARLGNPTNSWYGALGFAGTQTLGGNAVIAFGNSSANALWVVIANTTLTIGSGITLRGQSGLIGANSGWPYGPTNISVICQGTISADVSGGVLATRGQPFLFQGLLTTPAGSLDLGYIDNSGKAIVANVDTGSLTLSGGWIHGGSIVLSNDVRLVIGNLTLDGVTVNGDLDVGNQINQAALIVTNGLTLNGITYVGNPTSQSYGSVAFAGSQAFQGLATVVLGNSGYNALRLTDNGTTLTIGPSVIVRGQSGLLGAATSWPWYGPANVSVLNEGTISADAGSGAIVISGTNFLNQGLLEVNDGGGLQPNASNTLNTGTIRIDRATVTFPNNYVQSSGTLDFGLISPNGCGQIALNGPAWIGGTLTAHTEDGFIPAPGDIYRIINYGTNSVAFTNVDLPGPELWQMNTNSGVYLLSVADQLAFSVSLNPANATVAIGTNIQFIATPSLASAFTFQWQFNGIPLPNATNSTLLLTNVTKLMDGLYTVAVVGSGYKVVSAPAQLTVLAAPGILQPPLPQTAHVGDTVILNVVAGGDGPLHYEWLFAGKPITWGSQPSLTLSGVGRPQSGAYSVLVSNQVGAVSSSPVTLTIINGPNCPGTPPGLVAWWRGEGNAYDYAGTNDLNFIGAAFGSGKVGQGFALDGAISYLVTIGPPPVPTGTNDFSIEFWADFATVLPSVMVGDGSVVFVGCDEGSGLHNKWLFGQGGDQLYFYVNGPDVGAHFLAQAEFTPTTNLWYHLALTRQAGVYRTYVNGAQLSAEMNTLPIPVVNAPLTMGQAQGLFMDGLLDEVSLYNRALGANEVQAIYQAGASGKCDLESTTGIQLQAQLTSDGKITLLIRGGQIGSSVTVEATGDLKQWTPLGQVVRTLSVDSFIDPTPLLPQVRFYRVR